MGNCGSEACPTHPSNSITRICLCEACLEPLCEDCVILHNNIHTKLGYPSKIEAFDPVKGQYGSVDKIKLTTRQQRVAGNLAPTSFLIKNLTREYFEKSKNTEAAKILQNLEVWKEISQNPDIERRFAQFFKKNLIPNPEIVGKQFSHLY